ncbi:MAG: hypothetical protein FJ054_08140 [Cyanobacteria bacterium M_surface_10_m2_119]|nr:hypothetical protein [Cyanobacteria bacterium K_DeepCast_35m_m2_023]MBM5825313.1 hypothetical protein [Cyanobacteria bacterium M_surface_10_m2_119]
MTSESVSFRISRHTQDLAQTTHALSQRLVKLEQRLEAVELQLLVLQESVSEPEPEQLNSLENVERLLHDCRCLLGLDDDRPAASADLAEDEDDVLAA